MLSEGICPTVAQVTSVLGNPDCQGKQAEIDANIAEGFLSYIEVVKIRGVAYGNMSRKNCLCEIQK